MSGPPWCVVLDLDGTLTPKRHGSLFSIVNRTVLPSEAAAEVERLRDTYFEPAQKGLMGPEEEMIWIRDPLDLYVKHRVSYTEALTAVDHVRVRPGVERFPHALHRAAIPVAVVSYGVKQLIHWVLFRSRALHVLVERVYAADLEAHYDLARADMIVTGYDRESIVLPCNKGFWSREFADLRGVPHDRIIAIGDSAGDKNLGHLAGLRAGIADTEEEAAWLRTFMGHAVATRDFTPLAEWAFSKMGLPYT